MIHLLCSCEIWTFSSTWKSQAQAIFHWKLIFKSIRLIRWLRWRTDSGSWQRQEAKQYIWAATPFPMPLPPGKKSGTYSDILRLDNKKTKEKLKVNKHRLHSPHAKPSEHWEGHVCLTATVLCPQWQCSRIPSNTTVWVSARLRTYAR